MDREFALVLYRSLCMITSYLEKRFGFGKNEPQSLHEFVNKEMVKP